MPRLFGGTALLISLFFGVGVIPHRAVADDALVSGEGLLEACQELVGTMQAAGPDAVRLHGDQAHICWGFIGAMQSVSTLTATASSSRPMLGACLPPDGTTAQLVRVFVNFANSHPELLHEKPGLVALWAFRASFPCNN
jgi:hypothetical protein